MVAPATIAASAPITTATLVMRPIALSESTFGARSSVVTRKIPRNPASVARSDVVSAVKRTALVRLKPDTT